jgi:hypothetical protein
LRLFSLQLHVFFLVMSSNIFSLAARCFSNCIYWFTLSRVSLKQTLSLSLYFEHVEVSQMMDLAYWDLGVTELVVRSHEVKDEGYEEDHDGKLITVFSAPNYCDQMGNKGAFIRFKAPGLRPEFTKFNAVWHPNVRPMQYANNFFSMLA